MKIEIKYKDNLIHYDVSDTITWEQFKIMLKDEFNISENKQIVLYQSKVINSLDIIRKSVETEITITIKRKPNITAR